jgi:MFS transporter, YNFM family, putative membrane transport protein
VSSVPAAATDRALTRAIVLMSFTAFASGASFRVSDPLLPQVAADFGTSLGAASAIVTAYAVPYGLTQAFAGLIGDRLGKCQAVALACVVSCVLVLSCAAAQSLPQLTLARFVSAPGPAIIVPLGMAYIGDVVPYERRQPVLARFIAGQMFGMIAGQIGGGIIGDHYGWRTVFVVLAGVFAFAALALATQFRGNVWMKPVPHAGGERPRLLASYRTILSTPWPRFLLIAVFLDGAIFFGGFTYVAASLHTRFDLSFSTIGLIVAAFGVGSLLYAGSVRRMVGAIGEHGLGLAGGIIGMLGFLTLAGAPLWETAPLACGMLGFGYYMVHNTLQTNATQMLPQARAMAVAGFSSALFLGQSAGVALAAPLVDRAGTAPLFLLMSLLWLVLGLWVCMRLKVRSY